MINKIKVAIALIVFVPLFSYAQGREIPDTAQTAEKEEGGFKIAAVIGHTYINTGGSEGSIYIPSWGLDVDFWFNEKWGIGVHNDIEIENFIVEKDRTEFIERVNPLVFTLDVLYHLKHGLILNFGPGIEFEQNESFTLLRAGLEYEYDMSQRLYMMPTLYYDQRFDGYSTASFGIGIGYKF